MIVNVLKRIWADPVWSKVIAAAIIAASAGLYAWWSDFRWPDIVAAASWVAGSRLLVNIPILCLAALAAIFVALCWVIFASYRRKPHSNYRFTLRRRLLPDDVKWRLMVLIRKLEPPPAPNYIVYEDDHAALALAFSFRNFYHESGFKLIELGKISLVPDQNGILILVQDLENPPEAATRLLEAFGEAGVIGVRIGKTPNDTYSTDFMLAIGRP